MRVLILLAMMAVVAQAANPLKVDVPKDLLNKATMLETKSRSLVYEHNDEDTTQSTPIKIINEDSENECKGCSPLDTPAEDSEPVKQIRVEESEIDQRIAKLQIEIDETQKCADELEERKRELVQLTDRWSLLSEEEKKAILRNKMEVEESSIEHIHQMAEILGRKVKELTDAQTSINQKAELTKVAIDEVNNIQPPMKDVAVNVTEEIVSNQLGDELDQMHQAMRNSLEQSNNHITKLTSEVPGLHDVGFWSNITGVGGAAAKNLVEAMNSPERVEAFKKFMLDQNRAKDNNAAIDAEVERRKAAGISVDGEKAKVGGVEVDSLLELKQMKKELKAEEKAEELKNTIRKLKKKLRKKHKKTTDDY